MSRNKCSKCYRRHEAPTGRRCGRDPAASLATTMGLQDHEGRHGEQAYEGREDPGRRNGMSPIRTPPHTAGQSPQLPGDSPSKSLFRRPPPESPRQLVAALIAENRALHNELREAREGGATPKKSTSDPLATLTSAVTQLTARVSRMDEEARGRRRERASITPRSTRNRDHSTDSTEELNRRMSNLLGLNGRSTGTGPTLATEEDRRRGKVKSGRDLKAENEVIKEVPWPHHRVYRVPDLKGAAYDGLNPTEFCYGYMLQTLDPKNVDIRDHMIRHLVNILEDHKDFPQDWEAIRAYHSLILTYLERGILTWEDRDQFTMLRHKYVFAMRQKAGTTTGGYGGNSGNTQSNVCMDYNRGTCQHKRDHDGLKHVCSHCLGISGRKFVHAKVQCYKLNGPPKNPKAPQASSP